MSLQTSAQLRNHHWLIKIHLSKVNLQPQFPYQSAALAISPNFGATCPMNLIWPNYHYHHPPSWYQQHWITRIFSRKPDPTQATTNTNFLQHLLYYYTYNLTQPLFSKYASSIMSSSPLTWLKEIFSQLCKFEQLLKNKVKEIRTLGVKYY